MEERRKRGPVTLLRPNIATVKVRPACIFEIYNGGNMSKMNPLSQLYFVKQQYTVIYEYYFPNIRQFSCALHK